MAGGKAGAIKAGKAYYALDGDTSPLSKALQKARGMVTKSVALLAGLGITTAGAAAAAKAWASTGAQLVNAAKRANVSAAALGSLGYAAKQTGSDVGEMESALKGIRDKTMEAARGSDQAQLAFARLGINFLALSRMKPDDQLRTIAARLNAIPNPALRAAAATELLGSADLLPTLERLAEFEARAKRLGIVMSNEDAAAATKFDQALTDLWEITKSLGNSIAAQLAPALQWCVEEFAALTARTRDWIKTNVNVEAAVNTFKEAGLKIADSWDAITTGVQAGWEYMFGRLKIASQGFLGWFQKAWNDAIATVDKRLVDLREIAGFANLPGGLSEAEAKAARRKINRDRDRKNAAIDAEGGPDARDALDARIKKIATDFLARSKARGADINKLVAGFATLFAGGNAPAGNANPKPGANPKNDLANAAAGGIAQALVTVRGLGAQDVRSKEGFASVAASLRQQSIAKEQLYYTRRMVIALEKLGVLT
ncbi:MAG: hypothetical protein KGL39_22550 [Patescibacteria group bacterium]|nr:hypothetical protein [Patescibacteria group bacterium]